MSSIHHSSDFDPGSVGISNGNIFGFPYSLDEADIIIIPVPWDVTTSYQAGTSNGPQAILNASPQLDFADAHIEQAWKSKIAMLPIPKDILKKSRKLRQQSEKYICFLEEGGDISMNAEFQKLLKHINQESEKLNVWLEKSCEKYAKDKLIGILGGDHSTPLGFMRHLGKQEDSFGILQIDAHADLRDAYEDFSYSHASIMFNALKIEKVKKLVQLGIRDFSPSEANMIEEDPRIHTFYDSEIKAAQYNGKSWDALCDEILSALPEKVYISFDIDGLDPKLCPNTGTPVPGGLEFEQCIYLFHKLINSGRKIIGFDLCEVNPSENHDWNENVGARLLYKLCILASLSRKLG